MKKIFLFMILAFLSQYVFSQQTIDLSGISDSKKEAKQTEKKSTDTAKSAKDSGKKEAAKSLDKGKTKNVAKKKKPVKKNGKNYKYKFEKKENNVYKFDEKGNPIIPKSSVKKSTSAEKNKTDLSIGIEDKDVNLSKKDSK